MPKQYKFGKLNVLCEGYNSPEDPYILVGSCGVRECSIVYTDLYYLYILLGRI